MASLTNNYQSYLFLINPSSGSAKADWKNFIEEEQPINVEFQFIIWDKPERRNEIIAEIEKSESQVFVAVGGDGTINLLAEIAKRKNRILGIIPSGSGNGLARHLKIPLNPKNAIEHLFKQSFNEMDIASVNGNIFLCTAGVGFDALIGKEFASRDSTGFGGYIKKVLKQVFNYKAEMYQLEWKGKSFEKEAFMITFANASQYGNNAHIAPKASVQDGVLNICILKPFPLIAAIPLAIRLFTKSIDRSKYLETIKASEIRITRKPGPIHLDGDPFEIEGPLEIKIIPERIKVIY